MSQATIELNLSQTIMPLVCFRDHTFERLLGGILGWIPPNSLLSRVTLGSALSVKDQLGLDVFVSCYIPGFAIGINLLSNMQGCAKMWILDSVHVARFYWLVTLLEEVTEWTLNMPKIAV